MRRWAIAALLAVLGGAACAKTLPDTSRQGSGRDTGSAPTDSDRASSTALHERAWLLMGTAFEARIYAADSLQGAAALDDSWRSAARVDSLMSLYRPASELVRVNNAAGREPVAVSPETFTVLEAALGFYEQTAGAFDITVKPAMDAWGFYRRAGHAPDSAACDALRTLIDARDLTLDRAAGTARLNRAGMAIDLGGIAKGYALDEAARALRERGISAALLNLGGNILVIGSPPGETGWPVGIVDPRSPDSLLTILHLSDCSVSSSGGYEKFVILDGVRYGHILDPRTARPVTGVLGTTVIARDGMTADALSTALHVLGEAGMSRLGSRPDILGLFIAGEGSPLESRDNLEAGSSDSAWVRGRGLLQGAGERGLPQFRQKY